MPWVQLPLDPKLAGVKASSLAVGDVFSINEKATKLAVVACDDAVITVKPVGTGGAAMSLPMAEYGDLPVSKMTPVSEESLVREFSVYDKVKLRGANLSGIVIDINNSKIPDIDVVVKWDSLLHGHSITEVHPHEIEFVAQSVSEEEKEIAKQARQFLKNIQDVQQEQRTDDIRRQIVGEASKVRGEVRQAISAAQVQRANRLADEVISASASDIKAIVDAGGIMITAGAHDYEIEEVPVMMENYAEYIFNKVRQASTDVDLQLPATEEIMRRIAKTMMDSYFLLRQAYIRKHKGKYAIYSHTGKILGMYPSKEGAVKRLRQIEFFKHKKG